MRTAEGPSGMVLHRLIQEQLRYGNLTDTRTLLAIQEQALRGGTGSPRSSLESLKQEESQYINMSKRQEPQGQEHQGYSIHSEKHVCQLYQLHTEELPTYEEAKVHSQYLSSQQEQAVQDEPSMDRKRSQWYLKREHIRSLSERLLQLSLDRNGHNLSLVKSSSYSYPQLNNYNITPVAPDRQGAQKCVDQRGPPPDYPLFETPPGYVGLSIQGQYCKHPPPPFYAQHHRYVFPQFQVTDSSVSTPSSSKSSESNMLKWENEFLRKELESYREKATRLQKLELQIQRISEAYETLMKGSAKREALENTMRNKLEAEIKRMHDVNRDLRQRLDTAKKQWVAKQADCTDQTQNVFVKLLEQNEEQQEREQLEKQIKHLHISGEERQRKRELLEQVLSLTQARNQQLEEELRRKHVYVEKVGRLQSTLSKLQATCEKRETLELRLRTQLEQELKSLRARQNWNLAADPTDSEMSSFMLQHQLSAKEERILALEADITKWEQKCLEESTTSQFAMDTAATAAAQRDATIFSHSPRHSPSGSFIDDLPLSINREMENRVRALHAQLLEKDAVIKVLQQHSKWEQSKLKMQRFHLTKSFPSINTVTGSIDIKGKSLSDDPTYAAALQSQPCVAPGFPSRECSTQNAVALEDPELAAETETISAASSDTLEELKAPPKTFKSINSSEAEVVEILI